jgi:hypothetical protein
MSGTLGDDAQRALEGLQARGRCRWVEQSAGADRLQRPLLNVAPASGRSSGPVLGGQEMTR